MPLANLKRLYNDLRSTAIGLGAALVGYKRSETGAVARTVSDRLLERMSVFDFMTSAERADVRVGSFAVDVTAGVQAALDWLSVSGSGPRTRCLHFPQGGYKITSTLTYEGSNSHGIHLHGDVGRTRGLQGACLAWYGASAGTLFKTLGLNGSLIENLEFDGRELAKYCIHLDATNTESGSDPSSGNVLRMLTVSGFKGAGSAGIAMGHGAEFTEQVSEIAFVDIGIQGNGVDAGAGYVTLNGGNVKNFKIQGGSIAYCGYGADFNNASGILLIDAVTFAGNLTADVRCGAGTLTVKNCESETAPGCKFLVGTGGNNANSILLIGNSWQGTPDTDDIVINCTGHLTLISNWFYNLRDFGVAIPKIYMGGPTTAAGTPAGMVSLGNYYMAAVGNAPFFDGSGNHIWDDYTAVFYGDDNADVNAMSIGDYGGIGGGITHLTSHLPQCVISAGCHIGSTSPAGGKSASLIKRHFSGSKTWDPSSVANQGSLTTTVTVTGATVANSEVTVGFSNDLQGLMLTGYVSAADTVTVVLANLTGGAVDLGSGTLRASVWLN